MTSVAASELIELARRKKGVDAKEAAGLVVKPYELVRKTLSTLASKGKVHKATVSYRCVRYFGTAEEAERYVKTMHKPQPAKSAPAPKLSGALPVITPAGVKVTQCPSPLPPFQPAPSMPAPVRAGSMDFRKHQKPGRY